MKTLLFAMALALAGCKDKAADKSAPPTPAPAPVPTPRPAAPQDAGADATTLAVPNEPPVAVAGVPKECTAYEAAVERLSTCTQLDVNTRAKLRHDYNVAADGWKTMSSADKSKLTKTCTDSMSKLSSVAKKPCGW